MTSQFERTIRRAREKGESKLRVIAPKYKSSPGSSFGRPRRSGGGGSSSAAANKAAAQKAAEQKAAAQKAAAAKQLAEQKAIAEAKIKAAKTFAEKQRLAAAYIQTRQAQAEMKRILNDRANLIRQGAREDKRISTDARTGAKLEVSQWRDKFGNRIQRIKNFKTGLTTYVSFDKGRKTGGVSIGTPEKGYNILGSKTPGKLTVALPSGKKIEINATGRVVVGKALAGEQLVFQDGVLRKVDGRDLYEEKLGAVEVEKFGEIISTTKLKNLSKKWSEDISTTKTTLHAAAKRGDASRLAELQRLGNERTSAQNQEKDRLQKQTAKNYELGGELVGKIIGTSLINMGFGTVELLAALRRNPKETLIALPPAVYLGVKQDFNRVMSGDPLEIGSVGLEYWTFGKVGQIAGRIGKVGVKTSYGIGRTLSPKYFGEISKRLFIPPTTLRGLAIKTATGRTVDKAIKSSLKRRGITAKVTVFNKKLKIQKTTIDRKLASIQRRGRFVKARVKKAVTKAKTNVKLKRELAKSMKNARKIRIKAGKKGRTLHLTSPDYKKALQTIEQLTDATAQVKAYDFLTKYVRRGGVVTDKQFKTFVDSTRKLYRTSLENTPNYQTLLRLSKQDRFLSVKLIKQGKIKSAKVFFNGIKSNIVSLKPVRTLDIFIRNIKRGVKVRIKKVKAPVIKVRRKIKVKVKTTRERLRVKKRRAIKKIKRPFLVAAERRRVKKTIRYRMEKARPLRQVTFRQLQTTQSVTAMNKFIDRFFKELQQRQKITVAPKTYSQMKNILKKRMRRAIKTGDKAELKAFGDVIKKLAADVNKKANKPDVRVRTKPFRVDKKPSKKPFEMKTIKEFEPDTPKGSYMEVKSGQSVLLQRVKTKQIQKAKIVSVQKKSLNFKPLVEYGVKSLSATAFKNMLKSKQVFAKISNQGQLTKVLQDSAQDMKTIQAVASKVNVASAVASAVNSKLRKGASLKTKQILKQKKKVVKIRRPKKQTRKLSKPTQTYTLITRRRGKIVKLMGTPMILSDARDTLAYSIDNNLTKSAWFVPAGKRKIVANVSEGRQGYFNKVARKLRPYKIKRGKKKELLNGYIEKRKYFQDTILEKRQMVRARAKKKSVKRRITSKPKAKKKPIRRKPIKRRIRRRK